MVHDPPRAEQASSEPSRDAYDAVVVGGGLSGLATAALLARVGRSVLVAERAEALGGYAKPFRRGPYVFDPAIHTFPEADYIENLLDFVGVKDRVEVVRANAPFGARYPGFSFTFPNGIANAVEALVEEFPAEREAVRGFFELRRRIFEEAIRVPHRVGLDGLDAAARGMPTLLRYRNATVAEVIDEHVSDPRLRALLASTWPYMGSVPERAGYVFYSQQLGALLEGAFHVKGGMGSAVDALTAGIEKHGGELIVDSPVDRILVDGDRVRGVRLASGREVHAPLVISNADATSTLERLVGLELLPSAYRRKLARLTPSPSACALYTATTLPIHELGVLHETFLFKHWDHRVSYQDVLQGKPGGMWISVPSLVDPSLAPPGEHVVILTCLAVYDAPWAERADAFRERMLDELESVFPGYRDGLRMAELATPRTFERYSSNRGGAIYGWENTPRQTGSGRLAHTTPIEGLLLTGHWTLEGMGFLRALVSADATVQHVLQRDGDEALPSFRPAEMPALTTFEPT